MNLDCRFFPHIWSNILAALDFKHKLKLRSVSPLLKNLVDESLCGEWLWLCNEWKFCSVPYLPDGSYATTWRAFSTLPFFSPRSTEGNEMQVSTVRQAESIWLSVPNAARIVPLLQAEICPETDIEVFHGNSRTVRTKTRANNGAVFNTALAVPPCRNLTVHVRIPCGCASGSLTGVWSHSARVIDIAFKVGCPYDSPHVVCSEFHTDCCLTICPFTRHILTPTVEDVLISFYGYEDGIKTAVTRW